MHIWQCHSTGQRILYLYFQFNFETEQNPKRRDKSGNSESLIISFIVYILVFFLIMYR